MDATRRETRYTIGGVRDLVEKGSVGESETDRVPRAARQMGYLHRRAPGGEFEVVLVGGLEHGYEPAYLTLETRPNVRACFRNARHGKLH
jgi:hypothetical protein